MFVLRKPSCSLGSKKAFFMHNWRCAGSTMNSLLSSNFGDLYCKVGTQFSDFGWPLYDLPEKLSLQDIRSGVQSGGILGGHLCSGIQAFVPGEWDVWLNARKPFKRLSSGIIRFHAQRFRMPPGQYPVDVVRSHSEKILNELINGPLRHERNGIAKRLAGFSVLDAINLQLQTNLETLSCFEYSGTQNSLLEAARQNISNVKILILSEYLHASLICIEKIYNLTPIINLFSDLKHNQAALGKASNAEKKAFELAKSSLGKLCSQDEELWVDLLKNFQVQLSRCSISKREIAVREALHSRQVIKPSLFEQSTAQDRLIGLIATSLVGLARDYSEISKDIVDTATRWSRFDPDAAKEIRERAMHQLRFG